MAEKVSGFAYAWRVERRARRIADPVERLRYLRRAAEADAKCSPAFPWQGITALVLVAFALPLGSDTALRRGLNLGAPAGERLAGGASLPDVWPVENTKDYEVFSNGLRIEDGLAVSGEPRSYVLLTRGSQPGPGPRRERPAGIVFHTTESDLEPSKPAGTARSNGPERVAAHVRNRRAYHFVIDRFGRAWRMVAESDTANHAGHSVWGDANWLYVDLNASFLGVAFEARTETDQPTINPAQLHTAVVLTQMLRGKYAIAAENCVTHAQVSVNPDNMRIGWHTDWGSRFHPRDGASQQLRNAQPGCLSVIALPSTDTYHTTVRSFGRDSHWRSAGSEGRRRTRHESRRIPRDAPAAKIPGFVSASHNTDAVEEE